MRAVRIAIGSEPISFSQKMPPKEKEEVPEVWTQRWYPYVKIKEPQEMPDVMAKFIVDTTEQVTAFSGVEPCLPLNSTLLRDFPVHPRLTTSGHPEGGF